MQEEITKFAEIFAAGANPLKVGSEDFCLAPTEAFDGRMYRVSRPVSANQNAEERIASRVRGKNLDHDKKSEKSIPAYKQIGEELPSQLPTNKVQARDTSVQSGPYLSATARMTHTELLLGHSRASDSLKKKMKPVASDRSTASVSSTIAAHEKIRGDFKWGETDNHTRNVPYLSAAGALVALLESSSPPTSAKEVAEYLKKCDLEANTRRKQTLSSKALKQANDVLGDLLDTITKRCPEISSDQLGNLLLFIEEKDSGKPLDATFKMFFKDFGMMELEAWWYLYNLTMKKCLEYFEVSSFETVSEF
eukprot:GHVP01033073.1.p1 GENE.GHVP01033073.1~~GHVP01033073.1.p1  ORF type:complete len:318 (+),score=57.62 GHVP01033073.1:34-954(+)